MAQGSSRVTPSGGDTTSDVVRRLTRLVPRTAADTSAVRRAVVPLSKGARLELALDAAHGLVRETGRRGESNRILLAKALVALLPVSLGAIRALMVKKPDRDTAEAQFSLFCFLDGAFDFAEGRRTAPALLEAVGTYIHAIKSNAARAAWMAGDLLGDHWPVNEALPVLLSAVRTAKHPPGREAALHGLSHALERANKRQQWAIIQVLRDVAAEDRSRIIRNYAQGILTNLRKV